MKLGFVSAILPELTLEELIDYATELGYKCIEVCCWPVGKAERRYSGVTHIDVDQLDQKRAGEINKFLNSKGVEISWLGDIDWGKFFSALYDIRYKGPVCIEVEDKAFENSIEKRKEALLLSKRFLNRYL